MEENKEKLTKEQSFKLDLYFWLQALVVALVSLIVVFALFGRIIGVDGSSMVPTLRNKDLLLLQSIGYTPERGDVVVLNKPFGEVNGPIVKRVIATEGQTVSIDYISRTVSVDGEVLQEDYINDLTYLEEGIEFPLTLGENELFLLGDNRNRSSDSRHYLLGGIDERLIIGKAVFRIFPGKNSLTEKRDFSTIGLL